MNGQIEKYEQKIKNLIAEQEKDSKRYIQELQETHAKYRGIQSNAAEMDSRIKMYKEDYERATQAERESKKEVIRLTFKNDELSERHKYMEQKYLQLVQRVGAS